MTLLFEQGSLRVHHTPAGWRASCAAGAFAVDRAGDVTVERGDDGAPSFVTATALAARVRGRFHVHAGLVSDDDGGTLVCGESGAGKTTTTLALAAAGAALHGDDVALLERPSDDGVLASALPRPLHVGATTLAMFPRLRAHVHDGASLGGKVRVDRAAFPAPATPLVSVRRLVFPRVAGAAATTARVLSASEALLRLLPASAMVAWPTLPHADAHLEALYRLAHRATAVALDLGADAVGDPRCMVRALGAARALSTSRAR